MLRRSIAGNHWLSRLKAPDAEASRLGGIRSGGQFFLQSQDCGQKAFPTTRFGFEGVANSTRAVIRLIVFCQNMCDYGSFSD